MRRPGIFVYVADFANMLKAFIGSNYLSIAFAFRQSGLIPGIICLILIALLTDHCCHLIVKCKHRAIANILDSHSMTTSSGLNARNDVVIDDEFSKELKNKMIRNLSYGDIGKISFGKTGIFVVNLCIFLTQFGFCIAYFIFIGNTIQALFPIQPCAYINGTEHCGQNYTIGSDDLVKRSVDWGNYPAINDSLESILTTVPSANDTSASYEVENIPEKDDFSEDISVNLASNDTSENATMISSHFFQTMAPSLKLLVLIPLPLFIGFAYVRNVRHLGVISVWANLSIFGGAIAVFVYLIINFKVDSSYKYVDWAELPMFFGLVTASFEGIGTIIPIESSMEGIRHCFSNFLHGAIGILSSILLVFGILGYVQFGVHTEQMINKNLPSDSAVAIGVNVCLCIGVLLTFPLQMFPVIELAEIFTFADGKICGPKRRQGLDDDSDYISESSSDLGDKEALLPSQDTSHVPVATVISKEVSTLKRNTLRMVIVGVAAGLAVLFRDKFAYIGAFTGSIGSSLLAYILPCLFYMKLCGDNMPWYYKVKNSTIIVIGVVCSAVSLYFSILSLIDGAL